MTQVVSVKVKNIRPQYDNLADWMNDPNNVYIARKGVVFIDGRRFPANDSVWANPFKIDKDNTREEVVSKYREYIVGKLNRGEISRDALLALDGKKLGCWCKDTPDIACHGDVLVELIGEYKSTKEV